MHLHEDQDQTQRVLRNVVVEKIQHIFATTKNQILSLQQKELAGVYCQLNWDQSPWRPCTLRCTSFRILCCILVENAHNIHNQQEFGYMTESAISSPEYRELDNLGGEPFVFDWKIFPGRTTTQLLQEIQNLMVNELRIEPQNFEDCIMFISMYNDIDRTAKNNTSLCLEDSSNFSDYYKTFPMGHWTFHSAGDEKRWYGTLTCKPNGEWNRTEELMM